MAQHLSGQTFASQTFASQTFAIGLSCDQPHGFEHGDVLADISVAGSSRGTGGTTSSLPAQHIDHVFALQSAAPAILVEQGAARLLACSPVRWAHCPRSSRVKSPMLFFIKHGSIGHGVAFCEAST